MEQYSPLRYLCLFLSCFVLCIPISTAQGKAVKSLPGTDYSQDPQTTQSELKKLKEDNKRLEYKLATLQQRINQGYTTSEHRFQTMLGIVGIFGLMSIILLFQLGNNRSRQKQLEKLTAELHFQNVELSHSHAMLDKAHSQQKSVIAYLENFASVAAHDMRAPLRQVNYHLDKLASENKFKWSDPESTSWSHIKNNVVTLNSLIVELLEFSKLDQDLPAPKPINLGDVYGSVQNQLEESIEQNRSLIEIQAPIPMIKGHFSLLNLLFQNLYSNSIKYVAPGERAHITITHKETANGRVTIRFQDRGIGIPSHRISEAFELFKTFNTNPEVDSSGIGLATCKKIVDYYGGHISLESEESLGTTFTFDLPLA
ncbi:MAG: HAMP domain-containing sensor histidine kinase [Bacteroidota bacterium]